LWLLPLYNSPLAIGPMAILSCAAAAQAETIEAAKAAASGLYPSGSAVSSAQPILCRVDEAPFGYGSGLCHFWTWLSVH
jgi:hypothetical protein